MLEFEVTAGASRLLNDVIEERDIVRMNAAANQIESHADALREFENTVELLGPSDLASGQPRRKAADAAETLGFCQERLAAFHGVLGLRTLDRNARNVRDLRDQFLLTRRWARRFALIHAESTENAAIPRKYRRAPNRSQSVRQHMFAIVRAMPARVRFDVLGAYLFLHVGRYATRRYPAMHGQTFDWSDIADRKRRCDAVQKRRAGPIDRVHTAIAFGGGVFDEVA